MVTQLQKKFSFFDRETIKDIDLDFDTLTACTSGRSLLMFGDDEGHIIFFNKALEKAKHKLFVERCSHLKHVRSKSLLFAVGRGANESENAIMMSSNIVAVLRTDKSVMKTEPPIVRAWKVFTGPTYATGKEPDITAFSATEDCSQVAIGSDDGSVRVFHGQMWKELPTNNAAVAGRSGGGMKLKDSTTSSIHIATAAPVYVLRHPCAYPVTTMHYHTEKGPEPLGLLGHKLPELPQRQQSFSSSIGAAGGASGEVASGAAAPGDPRKTVLYVSTKTSLTSFFTHQNAKPKSEPLDEVNGCEKDCCCVTNEGDAVIGRPEGVFFFTAEDRKDAYGFDNKKYLLSWYKQYLLVVTLTGEDGRNSRIHLYDMKGRLTAFMHNTLESVLFATVEWGALLLVTNKQVLRLTERTIDEKLEILFRKNCYSIAVQLAYNSRCPPQKIMDIFKRYGDHLYEKCDYVNAIKQYRETIGHTPPSYIIRQFLDAQKINNLTEYLEALHEKGYANADHTTLLLNCYTKLKNVEKLNQFITPERQNNNGAAKFDVQTAISVCRAGYPEHALKLARAHNEHAWYLKIQIEDQRNYEEALEYIESLPFMVAEENLTKYGKDLVTEKPELTTRLLKDLCTGRYVPKPFLVDGSAAAVQDPHETVAREESSSAGVIMPPRTSSLPQDFIHLYVHHPGHLRDFLIFIVKHEKNPKELNKIIGNTLIELLLRDDLDNETSGFAFSSTADVADIDISTKVGRYQEVMKLLRNDHFKYDREHALVLVQMHNFKEGQLYLYEQLHMYHMVVQHHMETGDKDRIIKYCKSFADKEPNLWVQVLHYFAEKGDPDSWDEVMKVLQHIEETNCVPPLMVVKMLQQNKKIPLAVIKPFLVSWLTQEEALIEEDRAGIEEFREQARVMEAEIGELSKMPPCFRPNANIRELTQNIPPKHLYCGISDSKESSDGRSPDDMNEAGNFILYEHEDRQWLELKKRLEQKAGNHEQFFQQLETNDDGFKVVADYFGKGVFTK